MGAPLEAAPRVGARETRRRSFVVDTERAVLEPGRILAHRGPVGYVCVGFGEASPVLLAAFEQRGVISHTNGSFRSEWHFAQKEVFGDDVGCELGLCLSR